jgi:hypothetical protein
MYTYTYMYMYIYIYQQCTKYMGIHDGILRIWELSGDDGMLSFFLYCFLFYVGRGALGNFPVGALFITLILFII